ncbi:MAG: hypothetical protein OHK0039_38840 [Bacteroidia bacterium]
MKIVHIVLGTANPETMNGVNKVIYFLATHMLATGKDVEVWAISELSDFDFERAFVLRHFTPQKSRFLLDTRLRQALRELPDDSIVHFHSVFIPEFYTISRYLRRRQIPWVLTPHSGYSQQSWNQNSLTKKIYFPLFDQGLLRGAKAVHALGSIEIAELKQWNDRIIFIPNGQDPQPLYARTGTPGDKAAPVFSFCGRLAIQQKGLDLILEGFARYQQAGGRGELWLIGDSDERAVLEDLAASLGIADQVRFWGARFGDEKMNLLKSSDIFLHTSRWEGLPMSVLEAASIGLPLLLTHETNLGDYVTQYQAGVLLDANDAGHIAAALSHFEQLYEADRLAEIGQNGLRMIEQEFSWSIISQRICTELYTA